jgi:hypothetical protein
MNIMGGIKVAMLPIAAIVILQIVSSLVGLVPFIGFLALCSCVILIPVHGWVGYVIKKSGLTMEDSAAVGAIAGLISGVVNAIMSFVMIALGGAFGVATAGNDVATTALMSGIGAGFTGLAFLCSIPLYVVIGAVLAVAGYFIAQEMK